MSPDGDVPVNRQPFIDAINSDTSDRTPQLVYADWLDEQCNPLGQGWRLLVESGLLPRVEVTF